MLKVDFVFYFLGIFSYFAIIFHLKTQELNMRKLNELNEKKATYAKHLIAQREREHMEKAAEERKKRLQEKQKATFAATANAVEMLSNFSNQEVMRKSHITSNYKE